MYFMSIGQTKKLVMLFPLASQLSALGNRMTLIKNDSYENNILIFEAGVYVHANFDLVYSTEFMYTGSGGLKISECGFYVQSCERLTSKVNEK